MFKEIPLDNVYVKLMRLNENAMGSIKSLLNRAPERIVGERFYTYKAHTDSSGEFSINLFGGSYVYVFSKDGYITHGGWILIDEDLRWYMPLASEEDIDVQYLGLYRTGVGTGWWTLGGSQRFWEPGDTIFTKGRIVNYYIVKDGSGLGIPQIAKIPQAMIDITKRIIEEDIPKATNGYIKPVVHVGVNPPTKKISKSKYDAHLTPLENWVIIYSTGMPVSGLGGIFYDWDGDYTTADAGDVEYQPNLPGSDRIHFLNELATEELFQTLITNQDPPNVGLPEDRFGPDGRISDRFMKRLRFFY
ncbi:hypothetical protein J7M22_18290 [Candidatus Poribacteria bacterium]|nr:hypothetical protein [Candidatus Poribacteria bacterium]